MRPDNYSVTIGDYSMEIRRNSQNRLVVIAKIAPGIREHLISIEGEDTLFHLTKRIVDAKVPITTAARRNQQYPIPSIVRMKAPTDATT